MVTSTLLVCFYDAYALIDLSCIYSYVAPNISKSIWIESKLLKESFVVSSPVGEYIEAKRVLRSSTISIHTCSNTSDLIKLEMIDFDVIMCMDNHVQL